MLANEAMDDEAAKRMIGAFDPNMNSFIISSRTIGACSSRVEQHSHKVLVAGSKPAGPTIRFLIAD